VDESKQSDRRPEGANGLGGAVLDDAALDELLQRLVVLARHTVPMANDVSITVPEGAGYRTSNSTGQVALAIDQAQYDGDEGPCLEAMRSARQLQVVVGDSAQWPLFQEKALETGIGGVLSTPLVGDSGNAIGALNIYAGESGFGEAETHLARMLGEHAAILVGNALALLSATKLNLQLQQAVASREIIGEAKGIIMERQSCSRDEAFDILRRASQRENRKLRDLAEELVLRVEARRGEARPGR
jgi:GAF domain-containing protein